jgi:ABC-2 type transport system permease protein
VIARQDINPGLRDIFRLGVRRVYAYRMWTYLGVVLIFFQFVMVRAIWMAVYGDEAVVGGIPLDMTITYLSIVALMNFMLHASIADEIHRRIDQGQVAVDMVRPIGFIRQMVAIALGDSVGHWLLLVVVIPGLLLLGSLQPPAPVPGLVFVISLALAYVLNTLLWLLVGLSGFWLLNVSGMKSLLGLTYQFLSGSMIPLWFMPGPMREVVEWLPFQAIAFLPATIYVEQRTGGEMWRVVGVQVLWIGIMGAAVGWIWRRAQRHIVVQGG